MPIRPLAFAIAALILVGATIMLGLRFIEARTAVAMPASAPATGGVLVASRPLAPGHAVIEGDLAFKPWPADGIDPAYVVQGARPASAFNGHVVRAPLSPGEPVTPARLAAPAGRGALAMIAARNMRAFSVAVSPATGVSGLIAPGDRVDVVLTHTLPRYPDETYDRRVALTVLRARRVLAIDQALAAKPDGGAPGPMDVRTATLEVSDAEAETLALAAELGKLSLSLLALAGNPSAAPTGLATRDSQVSPLLGRVPRTPRASSVGAPKPIASVPTPARAAPPAVALFRGSAVSALETVP